MGDSELREFALTRTKEWNALMEKEMELMYDLKAEPIVTAADSAAYLDYLDEYSFASRKRGAEMMWLMSEGLARLLTGEGFEDEWMRPWKEATKERREEVLLQMLREQADMRDASKIDHRLLAPEITLDRLASNPETLAICSRA